MIMRQVTVKDIANKLNLHYTTVSKALSDHPDISADTKQRILTVAKELDYHPNSIAKSLKKQETSTIGLIVPSIKNDFFSAVISGIEEVAYGRGFNTVVCQSNENSEREAIHVGTMISNRVAGVLVSVAQTTKSGAHFKALGKQGIPLVFFDRVCDDIEADKVVVDDYDGAVQAVRHLIRSGYKRIAHLAGPKNTSIGRDRCRGYMDELQRNGIPIDHEMITYGGLEEDNGVAALRELLSRGRKPEAVFAVNDPVALGAYKEIKRNGLRIPQDVALIGFGNITLSYYLDPPLTTVSQFPYELGRAAAGMLLRRIENPGREMTPAIEVIKTELILRKSA
ncbi:MAG: LacI family transcriptional regulator [Planctomycetes bacterium RBG_13_44_8b]|nr:MAG: LacI family transcriptional regulator [Planctomycetes bacterium RBG_13_44_8b]